MNIIHCNPKTVSNPRGTSLSSGSAYLRRTFPALMVLAVWFVLAAGWGVGVDEVYAGTVDVRVSQSSDDAEESASGSVGLTSSDLELVRTSADQQIGMRFQNITIEQGAIINSAYIEFACDERWHTEATSLTFYGQAHNNALTFSGSSNNISHRVKTGASVTWNIVDQWATTHARYQSPDLASIIQEIVDRSGWESGNSLAIIVTGSGKRVAESWNGANGSGDLSLAPRLVIDYTGGDDKVASCRIYYRDNKHTKADSTTSLSAGAPSVKEGDLMIATVAFGNGDAVLSAPDGWTLIQIESPGIELMRTSSWYKVAKADESGPYLFSAVGTPDDMHVQIASFSSSAGADVRSWYLNASSYNYSDPLEVINSEPVDCVDNGLLYFAGSYDKVADVASQPSEMTPLFDINRTAVSLATYYQMRHKEQNVIQTIDWAVDPPEAVANLAAIAAVFSCQSTDMLTITATAALHGTIDPIGETSVPKGGSETFKMIPQSGYQVADVKIKKTADDDIDTNWEHLGALPSYTFPDVQEDMDIHVTFIASGIHYITASADPSSAGIMSPNGAVAVPDGADKTFKISAKSGYVIEDVVVDDTNHLGAKTSHTFTDVHEDHKIVAFFSVDEAAPPDDSCVEISDIPLEAQFQSAAPNILIALDDSGSMSYEILVPGAYDGRYQDTYSYVFDNPCGSILGSPGCHEYNRNHEILERDGRRRRFHWQTQWAGFNKVYYDPAIDYEPWPTVTGKMLQADPDKPRAHPMYASPTFELSSSYASLSDGSFEIIADNEDSEEIFTKTGTWTPYSPYNEAYNKHYFAARDAGSYMATWTPYVPGGTYQVYARWRVMADRSHEVKYTIEHAGGIVSPGVDQTKSPTGPDNWELLGTYTFNSGPAKVSLTFNVDQDNEKTVCADAIKFVPINTLALTIPRAHYYVKSAENNRPYLVILNKDSASIDFYEFYDANNNEIVDSGELLPAISPPADVKTGRSYAQERQNFANWYTYYRRRGYTATYATAELIVNMQAVRIGLYGINVANKVAFSLSHIQKPVNIKNNDEDFTEKLLDTLYEFEWKGGTPLRRALECAGRFYDMDDDQQLVPDVNKEENPSPWASADDGGECQQAFTIVITDGYYNGKEARSSDIKNNNIDYQKGKPYEDGYKNTLADIAWFYYEKDLNKNLADHVPTNPYDNATHQHMVTYTVGFGVVGENNPDDYNADLKHKDTGDYIVWPDPGKDSAPQKVDDLWHAAVNGRGQFLNSSNPKELVTALKSVMKDIERRVFSASGVAINGDEVYQRLQPDLLMFQASYSSEGWTGEVKAFKVNEFNGTVDTLNPKWSASEMLTSRVQSGGWDNRLIVTHNGKHVASPGIPFRYDNLTDTQLSLLDADYAPDNTTKVRNIINYLHGDTSEEARKGGALRNRFSVLGDIVHSAPVFKNGILYAGANDGMLHAFDVHTGKELFAYVPNLVFANLSALASLNYSHQYYVDLNPAIEDVFLSGVKTTMLVGGLGKGGRGYFALDVTGFTPDTPPATEIELVDHVMWEYPDEFTPSTEVNHLGYSFSKVSVVQSNDPTKPWIVIFGNGYNSADGHAVLFILDPATGELLKLIDTQVGDCNGLSTPVAVDVDYDNKVDYVYAGDLKGNLWKFDLSSIDSYNWKVAYEEGGTPKPLFKTPGQPITTKPSVMFHCEKHGYIVTFGTGKYLGLSDLTDTSRQSVYGIWDYGDDGEGNPDIPENKDPSEYVGELTGSDIINSHLPDTVSLLPQSIVNEQTIDGQVIRTLSDGDPDWSTTTLEGGSCGDNAGTEDCDPIEPGIKPDPLGNVGWYLNLDEPAGTGERVVTDVRIRAGILTVITYVNEGSQCGLAGHSWVLMIDPCTGGRLREVHFDVNGDGAIDEKDLVNIGTVDNPIMVPPTGIRIDGKVELPSYLINGRLEKGFYNTSDTEIKEIIQKAPKLGMNYWRVLRQ